MRLSRHAKNRLRRVGLNVDDVETIVHASTASKQTDANGNPCYFGTIEEQRFRVVVALDDPDFVITVHPTK